MHSTPCQSHQSVSGSSQPSLAIHCSPPRVLYRSTRKSLASALASEEQSRARMKTDAVVSLRCLQAAVFMVICYRWTRRVSKPDNSTIFLQAMVSADRSRRVLSRGAVEPLYC